MRGCVWTLAAGGIVGLILSVGAAQENRLGESSANEGAPATASRYFSRGDGSRSASTDAAEPQRGEAIDQRNRFLQDGRGTRKTFRLSNQDDTPPSRFTRSRSTTFERQRPIPDNLDVSPVPNYLRDLFSEHRFTNRTTSPPSRAARPAPVGAQPRHAGFQDQLPPEDDTPTRSSPAFSADTVNRSNVSAVPAVPSIPSVPGEIHRASAESAANAEENPTAETSGELRYADYERPAGEPERGVIEQVRVTDENVSPFGPAEESPTSATDSDSAAETGIPSAPPDQLSLPLPGSEQERPARTEAPLTTTKTTLSRPPAETLLPGTAAEFSGPQTPTITLHWIKQSDVNVGQECQCQLHVTNAGDVSARNVAIDAFFPSSVRVTETSPEPAESTDRLTWRFSELAPGEKQVMSIRMFPTQQGEVTTTAFVTFTAAASGLFRVTEPLLAVDVEGPAKVLVGDPASQIIRISNPGTGIATNITLEALVPQGLQHPRGERLAMEIGSLNPGETRVVRLALASAEGGDQVLEVQVSADAGLEEIRKKTILVVEPSLAATITGPESRYVGHAARYTLTVANTGDVASNNVRALYRVPKGFQFLRAAGGARFDAIRGTVSWYVGRLAPGESIERTVFLTAAEEGNFSHTAAATSEHGATAETRLATHVEGTASLSVEIVERDDPVQVGVETAFEIRVQNDGSKPAQSVGLSIELPAGVKYQSARGPAEHIATNGLLVFKSIDRLDPGKTAIYRVYVLGTGAGNHRIRARVASDSIGEPLISEEMTKFFSQ